MDGVKLLTIGQAKDLYRRFGHQYIYPECLEMVDALREAGSDEPIGNSSYLHALALTEVMINHTHHQYRMIAGPGISDFISVLHNSFERMLRRLSASNGSYARIIVLDADDRGDKLCELERTYPSLVVADAVSADGAKEQNRHYIVCDGDMVREEEYHEPLSDGDDSAVIKADVYFDNPAKVRAITAKFDQVWDKVSG